MRVYQENGEWFAKVTPVSHERYDGGPIQFSGSLDEVIASFNAVRDAIPEEHRESARCEIDSNSGYEGTHYASVVIHYVRPATDEEIAKAQAEIKSRETTIANRERAELQRLKLKYGN